MFSARKHTGGDESAPSNAGVVLIARLNSKTQPIDRGDFYEDPLHNRLEARGLGAVSGGGTQLMDEPHGIAFVDVEIFARDASEETLTAIIEELEAIGVPKGSKLFVEKSEDGKQFGTLEGLGLFLNGVDLPTEVYETSDVNELIRRCGALMGDDYAMMGYWQGARETGLYFYGPSFEHMKIAIENFVANSPLCQMSRIEQIA
ncbi:hypothetical protein [Pontivivens insulae]|uniref:Uncharacterized protein n=1 Tax=Pontivivens insulae TaxID=1639689 RepID=A0A2R8AAM9_9RHOB|nr:hypothetical protein [Pontivivens insulae]RED13205.1 hypothetical protein DFR53_2341 [Pontivivens insulae]SPF29297.1 hypothetical protein POI8812_01605 [Pontivivens insulae]